MRERRDERSRSVFYPWRRSRPESTVAPMRAWQITQSFGLDHLVLGEERPRPLSVGEARLRLRSVSLNYRDLMMIRGEYNPRQTLPFTPCSDAVGTIVELGSEAQGFALGDRVCPSVAVDWQTGPVQRETPRNMLGGPLAGTLAEELVVPAACLVKIPDGLSDEGAASLPCAGVTAYSALFDHGALKADEIVVTQGSGGVATLALQLAKAAGARVIAITGSAQKVDRLRALGADEVIDYRKVPNWGREVQGLTQGRGADYVIEVGGAGTLAQSLQAVRAAGRVAIIGVLAGASAPIDLRPIMMRGIRLQGVFVGPRENLEALVRFVAARRIEPVVDRIFALEQAKSAFEHLQAGAHLGKVVVRVTG